MTGLLGNAALDLALVLGVILLVVLADIVPTALRRKRDGGALLHLSDFRKRAHVLVLVPLALVIVLQQNIFAFFGYETREDVPFYLGILVVLALAAVVLVWMQRKKD